MNHPRNIARKFARSLTWLRDGWDVHYVGADPIPGMPNAVVPPPQTAEAGAAAEAPKRAPAAASAASSRAAPAASPSPQVSAEALRSQAKNWTPATKLEYLRRRNVGDCRRCLLSRTRTNIVFGVGSAEAKIMFVGEAPGADEDRQGEPFVGRAGRRLTEWIEALGLTRDRVYIANVLKCRPPGNRDPNPDEIDKCSPFLAGQVRAIRPEVIVALGRHAGNLLARKVDATLSSMRRSKLMHDAGKSPDGDPIRIPLVVTYHPSFVLRRERSEGPEGRGESGGPNANEMVLGDLRKAMAIAYPDAGA